MIGGFRVAIQFLTRIAVPGRAATSADIAWSYYFYPVVGVLLGGSAIVLRALLATLFPPSFSIILVLAFLIWITGGLHEDGLADVTDAMAGGWTAEDRLRIMKDSRVGALGALALVVAVLSKYVALSGMNPMRIDGALLVSQVVGRWAFVPMGYFNNSAREGLGSQFMKGVGTSALVVTSLFSIAVLILVGRTLGAVAFCSASGIVALASLYFRRRLGGVTGDCFGATFQFVEIATYAIFLT
jgi:adenosylcobinamide-GDP ribazoletransferase